MQLIDIRTLRRKVIFVHLQKKMIINCNSLLTSRNMKFYLINTEQMHGNVMHIHGCLSAINHQMFMESFVCMCL